MKQKLTITTADYAAATRYADNFSCPMSMAVLRQFPSAKQVSCSMGSIHIYNEFSSEFWSLDPTGWDGPREPTSIINARIATAKQGIEQETLTFIIERISILEIK